MNGYIDGEWTDDLRPSLADAAFLRGDGCFEVLRIYSGKAFEADAHLDRLQQSASALRIDVPDRTRLRRWVDDIAATREEGAVRIVLTRGSMILGVDEPSRCLVFAHRIGPIPSELSLLPVRAPWHGAGVEWELAGAKTLSYAPNLAAGRHSREAGFDDALLVTTGSVVLEGPNFSVAWWREGYLETPSLELDILDSITRRVVIELALQLGLLVREVVAPLETVYRADEVMALSTTKEVLPVTTVGSTQYSAGPTTGKLAAVYRERVRTSLEI